MSRDKLIMYYLRLTSLGVRADVLISLPDVAGAMFTSVRHCRTLLKEMHEAGWLEWIPRVGRNQRSTLHLKFRPDEIKVELANEMICEGRYEKALELVDNDQALFGQLLQQTSGVIRREGRLHIQLTYARPFSELLPHIPLRNSERFLLRQIYCCLTRCDEKGNITPELAHHWSYDEKSYKWRFYLRPELSFHDGSQINAEEIAGLFNGLRALAGYREELAHLVAVSAVNLHCVEFQLSEPDPGFAGLLADGRYSVQPVNQLSSKVGPVGCGAFQVQEHSNRRIQLKAFSQYYGCRAIADTFTVWQVDPEETDSFGQTTLQTDVAKKKQPLCSHHLAKSDSPEQSPEGLHTGVEDGCMYILFNHRAGLGLAQRKCLSQLLSSDQFIDELSRENKIIEAVPARNLLPGWLPVPCVPAAEQLLTDELLPNELSIALFEHQALMDSVKPITSLLQKAGVTCRINLYPFEEFNSRAQAGTLNEDLILSCMNLDDNLPGSAYRWLHTDPALHQSLAPENSQWLKAELRRIRQTSALTEYMSGLEALSVAMLGDSWLLPLFHQKQTLHFEGVLKGVSITPWGWPSIQEVWAED